MRRETRGAELIFIFEKKYLGGRKRERERERERDRVREWVLGRRREGRERVGGCRERERAD